MITAVQLFGRSVINAKKQRMLEAANRAAATIFAKRLQYPYAQEYNVDTPIAEIEKMIIEAIKLDKRGVANEDGS